MKVVFNPIQTGFILLLYKLGGGGAGTFFSPLFLFICPPITTKIGMTVLFGLILRVTVLQTQSLYSVGGKAGALYADSCRGALEQVHHLALLNRPT